MMSIVLQHLGFYLMLICYGGARGVMEEMDTAIRVQILDEADCISHCTNTLGKGMNPIIYSPSSYG